MSQLVIGPVGLPQGCFQGECKDCAIISRCLRSKGIDWLFPADHRFLAQTLIGSVFTAWQMRGTGSWRRRDFAPMKR